MVDPAEDLRRAAVAVMSGGSAHSLDIRTSVAETLQWMAMSNITGSEFGQGVAERARAIGGDPHLNNADQRGEATDDGGEVSGERERGASGRP